jgi:uncharacterized membrane protein YraQ (UPF0718 family)
MDIKLLVLLGIVVLLILLPQENWSKIWSADNVNVFVILIFAVPIAFWIDEKIGEKFVKKINKEKFAIPEASVLGIATPGPVYAMFPLTGKLKKKGIRPSILVAFLTGQTSIGPIRLMLETGIFGFAFITARIIAAVLVSIISGFLTIPLDKKI